MGIRLTTDADLTSVANAIRTKGGTNASLSYPTGFVNAIGAISTGGSAPEKDVNFIDYDGTIVYSYTAAEFANLSALPANPTHPGLTAQGWNWSLSDAKTYVATYGKLWIGQMYVTTSGATEIDVKMLEGRLSPILTIAVKGTVNIDWGDGTTPNEVTGESLTTRLEPTHTYASAGNYTIKISETTGSEYSFYCTSSYTLLRKSATSSENKVYANCIKNVRIGNGIKTIYSYAFQYCTSLTNITIPNSVTSIKSNAFIGCYALTDITIPNSVTSITSYAFSACSALTNITIPNSVTSIAGSAFQSCTALTNVTIPNSVTSIEASAFSNCLALTNITIPNNITSIGNQTIYYCAALTNITIPENVTSIGSHAFTYCYSFTNVTIPNNVTSIEASAFSNCCGVAEYHLLPTIPPTLANTNAFNSIPSDCIIYVPYSADHSILAAYKGASNWSTYADYMQEEPQS